MQLIMAEFIIMVVIVAICCLLFGKADTKKDILNQIGLDLSESAYESKKESEFAKYSKQAIKKAISLDDYNAKDETQFLEYLSDKLYTGMHGKYVDYGNGEEEYIPAWLHMKSHYIEHANTVVGRRIDDIKKGNTSLLSKCDFTNKSSAKRYAEVLWNKYQYPWPKDWMKRDSM